MEENEMFIVVAYGEFYSSSHSRETAIGNARNVVDQHISDHMKHMLPLQVTDEVVRAFDVRVYACGPSSMVQLPFQEWVDENYRHREEYLKESEALEYKRFLELRSKYEDKYQQEFPSRLPNCS